MAEDRFERVDSERGEKPRWTCAGLIVGKWAWRRMTQRRSAAAGQPVRIADIG
ncbi:MAG: hypothetical protein GXP25_03440 [Planctomycetes bacterium]|nr:hypothetical protein [Planctomycetota bacterium]